MDRRQLLMSVGAVLLSAGGCATAGSPRPTPPATLREPRRIAQLGRVRVDEYAWLKDEHWLDVWRDPSRLSPRIRAHLEAENAYAAAVLGDVAQDQRDLVREMIAIAGEAADAPPVRDGDWLYGERHAPGASHQIFFRTPAHGGAEQVLLDAEARAAGKSFFHIGRAAHSPDHNLFAWTEDDTGGERFRLFVKDLTSGTVTGPISVDAFGDFVFSPDSRFLYWTWRNANSRPARIYRTPVRGGADVLAYEETDPGMYMQVGKTASGRFVRISILNADHSEMRLIGADGAAFIVAPREAGHFYEVEDWGDDLVMRSNADGAVDFKLFTTRLARPQRANWRELAPHRPGRVIIGIRAFARHLARVERVDAKLEVILRDRAGAERRVAFPEDAYVVGIDEASPYEAPSVRLAYQSPRTPPQWIEAPFDGGPLRVIADQAAPGYDRARYIVRRLNAPSSDGVLVPIAVLAKHDTPIDGSAPLLLNGYGSYGYTQEDEFVAANVALADRGWVVAVAHVRGGGERGRAWYEAARQTRKHNSFVDFNASAEYLIANGYAHPRKVVSYGYSAGGLLVGASLNLRPDLYAGVIARAPYVDCLNTMSDDQHPLAPLARPDWGDPLVDPVAYDYIASYSPYENVHAADYPPVLATTAVSDDRVGYWEPAKWIANLRAHSTSSAPMLLRTNMNAGHGGASGRLGAFEDMAGFYSFALWAVRQ